MASRRILKSRSTFSFTVILTMLVAGSLVLGSCGTTSKTSQSPGGDTESPDGNTNEESAAVSEQLIAQINTTRSSLDDVYATQNSDIPAVFRQQSTARDIGNPREGYRVQILSTRNVNQADSVANDFRFWAEENFKSYIPKAYVRHRQRQPYYKVRIGNFQFHDHAMKLNQFLKAKYPDAWVVHDEVEPNLVPQDTVSYSKK